MHSYSSGQESFRSAGWNWNGVPGVWGLIFWYVTVHSLTWPSVIRGLPNGHWYSGKRLDWTVYNLVRGRSSLNFWIHKSQTQLEISLTLSLTLLTGHHETFVTVANSVGTLGESRFALWIVEAWLTKVTCFKIINIKWKIIWWTHLYGGFLYIAISKIGTISWISSKVSLFHREKFVSTSKTSFFKLPRAKPLYGGLTLFPKLRPFDGFWATWTSLQ